MRLQPAPINSLRLAASIENKSFAPDWPTSDARSESARKNAAHHTRSEAGLTVRFSRDEFCG